MNYEADWSNVQNYISHASQEIINNYVSWLLVAKEVREMQLRTLGLYNVVYYSFTSM